jgi:hypothetical protein
MLSGAPSVKCNGFSKSKPNAVMALAGSWPWHLDYGKAKRSDSNGNMWTSTTG